jgi:hypothetical protein
MTVWMIYADGIPWVDADGTAAWPEREAVTLAALIESLGYEAGLVPA